MSLSLHGKRALVSQHSRVENGSVGPWGIGPCASIPSHRPSPALPPSDPLGACDSRPQRPPQRLPHAEAQLPDLAAFLHLAADR